MKINKNFLVHTTGNETVIVPTGDAGFSGVVQGNETFGIILGLLKENTTEQQQIVDKISQRHDASRSQLEKDVVCVIS